MEFKTNFKSKKLSITGVERKVRKKMYKSKKHWMVASLAFFGVCGAMSLGSPVAHAEEVANEPVTVKMATESDNPPTKAVETVNEAAKVEQQKPVIQNEIAPAYKETPSLVETKTDTVPEPAKVEETVPNKEESTNSNVETPTNNNTTKPKNKTNDDIVTVMDKDLEAAIKEAEKYGVIVNKTDDKVVKDHNEAVKDYAKQIEEIKKAIQKAKEEKVKHDEEVKRIDEENKKIAEYNKVEAERVAKEKAAAEKNKHKDGYLSEVEAQKLIFEKEKNSKMTVTSGNKKLKVNQVLNQAKKNTNSDYLLGKIQNLAKNPAYNLKVGEKLTVEYTLNNSFYDKTKLGKVQYTYTLKQANVNSKDGLIFLLSDPTDTMYYVDYYTGSMKWNMSVIFFDENGKQIDVSDSLVSFASLNTMTADSGGLSREYVENFNGKYISINGSSVQQKGNKVYSEKANTFKVQGSKYDGTEWDYSGSSLEYYGAIAGKTGKTISFEFGSNESGYIWFSFNSKVKTPTITPADYKTPKKSIKYPDAKTILVIYNLNKYVPKTPTAPTKTVSDDDDKKVLENLLNGVNETFTYNVSHVVDKTYSEAFYDSYIMKDTINQALSFTGSQRVLNAQGTDVTHWFTVKTDRQTITFTLLKEFNNANFYDNMYTYIFGVNIKEKEAFVKKFAGRLTKFDNEAIVEINGAEHKSNVVTTKLVIPAPVNEPSKTVSDSDEKEVLENLLNGVSENFRYTIKHVVPQADKEAYYKTFSIKDTVDEHLDFDGRYKVLNELGQDMTAWLDITTDGQTILFTLKEGSNRADFYGHTYTFTFGVLIKEKEAFIKKYVGQTIQFDNIAKAIIDGAEHDSTAVITKVSIPEPVKPTEPQEPVKLVYVPKKIVPVTLPVETPQKTLPQTGETGNIKAGLVGSVLTVFGLSGIMINRRKKEEK